MISHRGQIASANRSTRPSSFSFHSHEATRRGRTLWKYRGDMPASHRAASPPPRPPPRLEALEIIMSIERKVIATAGSYRRVYTGDGEPRFNLFSLPPRSLGFRARFRALFFLHSATNWI